MIFFFFFFANMNKKTKATTFILVKGLSLAENLFFNFGFHSETMRLEKNPNLLGIAITDGVRLQT